ncbi:MAG: hypothetical protein QOF78_3467 [Phycisphaerales bacterium]|nr:hypothetical protein [Phycisphaerales bacterium]
MPDALDYRPSFGAVHYKPRGHFDLHRAIVAIPTMMLAALLVGAAYGAGDVSIRQIIFKGLALGATGVAVGLLAVGANRWARVRPPSAATLIAVAIGFAALYGSWVAWVSVILARIGAQVDILAALRLAIRPLALWGLMTQMNAIGVWSYRDNLVHGWPLTAIWVIEALALILIPAVFATRTELAKSDRPYCEKCRRFLVRHSGLARFAGDDLDRDPDTIAHIERRDFDHLLTLGPPADEDAPYIGVELLRCPKCGETNTLSFRRYMLVVNEHHQLAALSDPLIERLLITREQAEQIIGLKERLPKAAESLQSAASSAPPEPQPPPAKSQEGS